LTDKFFVAASLAALTIAVPAVANHRSTSVDSFINEMVSRHGFDRKELEGVFDHARFRPKIVELMDRQKKPTLWREYRERFVNAEKLAGGDRFWQENEGRLRQAREKYGVPEEFLIAVIGVETHYGRHQGRFKVFEALSTLAFTYPKRAKMFRTELEHYLLLAREESLSIAGPRGSYAGAMGIAQFMPGSYRRYAVDFDGDGKRDLFGNNADAIGSIANYLAAHGWQRDGPVATRAILERAATGPFESSSPRTRFSLKELESRGVTATGAFPSTQRAMPLTLESHDDTEYWLGFDNFYVITRYNHSTYYAMAVYQLSAELRRHRDSRVRAGDR